MTKDELRMTGEALIALSEGKKIEYFDGIRWVEGRAFNFVHRIKAEPKKRLMRHDEFPAVWWFREDSAMSWRLVTVICSEGFHASNCLYKMFWGAAKSDWQWSPDRKEIRSFFVEEEA